MMKALSLFGFATISSAAPVSSSTRRMGEGKLRYATSRYSSNKLCKFRVNKIQRRSFLQLLGCCPILYITQPIMAAPMKEMLEPEVIRTIKLDSGVRIQEIVEGKGPEAREGDLVEINYVCRRANGYFVYSTVDQFSGESAPVILRLDENQIIKGLKEVLTGMKVGGKRRALIPPSAGYIKENLNPVPGEFGPRRSLFAHSGEPLVFEVQLLKVL